MWNWHAWAVGLVCCGGGLLLPCPTVAQGPDSGPGPVRSIVEFPSTIAPVELDLQARREWEVPLESTECGEREDGWGVLIVNLFGSVVAMQFLIQLAHMGHPDSSSRWAGLGIGVAGGLLMTGIQCTLEGCEWDRDGTS